MVAVLTFAAYAGRLSITAPAPRDLLFRWSFAIETAIGDAILLGFMLLIARGVPKTEAFALRRPRSWPDALRIAVSVVGLAYLVSAILIAIFGFGAREQGMPVFWDGTRALPYLASLLVVAVFVPIVEETTCRGLGFRLLQRWGDRVAIGGSALAFALMHGAFVDFPWVLTLGLGLGYLRARSASLYPSMLTHGFINGVAVIAAAASAGTPS